MASSKVRTNVARMAAGAVFAAGASLAIAGVAQADNGGKAEVSFGKSGDDCNPAIEDCGDPDPTDPEPTDPDPTDPDPTDPEPTDPEPTDPDPTEPEPTDPDPTDPDPTEPDPTDPDPTDGVSNGGGGNGGNGNGGGGNGGGGNGGNGGTGPAPNTAGATEGIEAPDADEGLTDADQDDDAAGGQDELAQTGASGGETLLLIGAATMVAGGVAFRYLPKALGKSGATA